MNDIYRKALEEINSHPYYDIGAPDTFESGIKRLNKILDTARNALAEAGKVPETAWVIELKKNASGMPRWYSDTPFNNDDISKAIRFSRKQDAEAVISEFGWDAFASEHVWLTAAPNPPIAGEKK